MFMSSEISKKDTDTVVAAGSEESPTDVKFVQKSDQPERSLAVDSSTAPMPLAYGEKVLLQTATVPIQGFDSSFTVSAHVLLDSASQRTFMTDSLAKRLGLKPEQKELLSITTFGAGKATNIDTYVVRFNVKLKDGLSMLLFANVLKQITGNIQRSLLHQNDVEF